MSKNLAIKIENVSKMYDLGMVGTGTLSKDLNRTFAKLRGKPDPYATLAEINDRTTKSTTGTVWAIKDINFEVERGEVLGIIGRNGAGKSTLLKILSKITAPTTGNIKTNGRLASLLEVGTGMHPEMTASENIFLNGAIMGMTRPEIKKKFDDIVDFAGINKYVDTPIKRFSSGMKVRLGFAVAAFLEPEILVVDEVLAVGDAEFQKRAVGKMKEVSQGGDRTVLFVSHNMGSVQSLCNKGLLMNHGQVDFLGNVEKCIEKYLNDNSSNLENDLRLIENRSGNQKVIFSKFYIENLQNHKQETVLTGDDFYLVFEVQVKEKSNNINVGFSLHDSYDSTLSYIYSEFCNRYYDLEKGIHKIRFKLNNFSFASSTINVRGRILVNNIEADWPKENIGVIKIEKGDYYKTGVIAKLNTPYLINGLWE